VLEANPLQNPVYSETGYTFHSCVLPFHVMVKWRRIQRIFRWDSC